MYDNDVGKGLITFALLIAILALIISVIIKGEVPTLHVKCDNCIERASND